MKITLEFESEAEYERFREEGFLVPRTDRLTFHPEISLDPKDWEGVLTLSDALRKCLK